MIPDPWPWSVNLGQLPVFRALKVKGGKMETVCGNTVFSVGGWKVRRSEIDGQKDIEHRSLKANFTETEAWGYYHHRYNDCPLLTWAEIFTIDCPSLKSTAFYLCQEQLDSSVLWVSGCWAIGWEDQFPTVAPWQGLNPIIHKVPSGDAVLK